MVYSTREYLKENSIHVVVPSVVVGAAFGLHLDQTQGHSFTPEVESRKPLVIRNVTDPLLVSARTEGCSVAEEAELSSINCIMYRIKWFRASMFHK